MNDLASLAHLIENLIRFGTIAEIQMKPPRVRVKTGSLTTGWLPWIAPRAGADREWNPPTVNEQVIVFSPSGQLGNGIVLTGLFSDHILANGDREGLHRITYRDGTKIEYDSIAHHLNAALAKGGTTNLISTGGIHIVGPIAHEGDYTQTGNQTITGKVTVSVDVVAVNISLVSHTRRSHGWWRHNRTAAMNRETGAAIDRVEHIAQSVTDILTTRIGNRVMRREYGSLLSELVDQPFNDFTRLQVYAATVMARMRREPRISLSRVQFLGATLQGQSTLDLEGSIVDSNEPLSLSVLLQRVADTLKMDERDIRDGQLAVQQGKTSVKRRIEIVGELKVVIDRIMARKAGYKIRSTRLVVMENGQPITTSMLRKRFDDAREAAGIPKADFQMRDLRAKAATDKEESTGNIRAARDQLGHTTVGMTEQYIRMRKGMKVTPTK